MQQKAQVGYGYLNLGHRCRGTASEELLAKQTEYITACALPVFSSCRTACPAPTVHNKRGPHSLKSSGAYAQLKPPFTPAPSHNTFSQCTFSRCFYIKRHTPCLSTQLRPTMVGCLLPLHTHCCPRSDPVVKLCSVVRVWREPVTFCFVGGI